VIRNADFSDACTLTVQKKNSTLQVSTAKEKKKETHDAVI
jgi:hypothetical protein